MLSRKSAWGAAALLAAWLVPVPASAATGSFASSPAGERVHAGEIVPLSWTLDATEIGDRDEMELVLSLDDGATFPVRVVAGLETADGGVSWRVPALPTEHARLAIRAGEDGRDGDETIVAVSEPFAIATSRFESLEPLYAVAGEWRTRDALEGAPARSDDGLAPQSPMPDVAPGGRSESEPETSPLAEVTPAAADDGRPIPAELSQTSTPETPRLLRAPLPLRL